MLKSVTLKIISIVIIIFVLAGVGIAFYYWQKVSKIASSNSEKTVFEIKEGESTLEIAEGLEEDGYIRSAWYFATLVKYRHHILQPGAYLISPNMKVSEIINKISSGETSLIKITIPEGWRREQIAQYLDGQGSIEYQSFITAAEGFDGKLFPDTFYVTLETTAEDAVKLMNEDYIERIDGLEVSDNDLVLASIVEREGKSSQDRPVIAGILLNRLRDDHPLQVDATLQYVFGYQPEVKTWWKKDLTDQDKTVKSPDNTYANSGLPPNPLANPGLAAISAVAHPTKTSYWYYLHDKEGKAHYAETLEQHNANIEPYLR